MRQPRARSDSSRHSIACKQTPSARSARPHDCGGWRRYEETLEGLCVRSVRSRRLFLAAVRRWRTTPTSSGRRWAAPFGDNFWFVANFQTAQNPFNPANTHVTSSDIAFFDDLAYVGDYGGFRIFDISRRKPQLVSDTRCYGPQGDPSVFDRDGDGEADTLVLSVDSVLTGPECGAAPATKVDDSIPGGGVGRACVCSTCPTPRLRSRSPAVYQDCGSHTNTLLPAPGGTVDLRPELELPAGRRPHLWPARRRARSRGQPRRRPGRRGAVRRPDRLARADRAPDPLPG